MRAGTEMTRRRVLAGLGAVPALLLAGCERTISTHRYRLTLDVETPGGVRSGSSVMEVTIGHATMLPGHPGGLGTSKIVGEAVFVDLGGGRHVISIFGFGPDGGNYPPFHVLALEAYGLRGSEANWRSLAGPRGAVELPGKLIPSLVTFADLADPATARVVAPDAFEAVFGPGVKFKRATIEMVSPGWWPLNLFGIGGEPVTRGIEGKLGWWSKPLPWVKPSGSFFIDSRPFIAGQYRLQREHFKRGF